MKSEMNRGIQIAVVAACCLAASAGLWGQSAPPSDSSQQNKPPADARKPADQRKPAGDQANPFPEDTTAVPVVPVNGELAAPAPDENSAASDVRLPGADSDPVRSPDDFDTDTGGSDSGFSSSLQGMDDIKPPPDEGKNGKHRQAEDPIHQETAAEDINVGGYYLERKNWKAALSRFQAAIVLAPDNPDVYWGMAEAQRELGDFAKAKANYLKVMDYDPDSKHGKEAKKLLKAPELASTPAAPANPPAAQHPQ
jgi:tetratricopeptide (TPR) repeat protein